MKGGIKYLSHKTCNKAHGNRVQRWQRQQDEKAAAAEAERRSWGDDFSCTNLFYEKLYGEINMPNVVEFSQVHDPDKWDDQLLKTVVEIAKGYRDQGVAIIVERCSDGSFMIYDADSLAKYKDVNDVETEKKGDSPGIRQEE